jgi:hypothetical protein
MYLPQDFTIALAEVFKHLCGPLYSLSHPEWEELKCWVDKKLTKGFSQTSARATTAAILSIKTGDSSLRLVIDYTGINEGTIRNGYPLLLLQDMLLNLSKAKWLTKLDICTTYNLICMVEGEEWKTVFCTCYGLFKSLVMPFGLTNAPAMFQNYFKDILAPYLHYFCTAY